MKNCKNWLDIKLYCDMSRPIFLLKPKIHRLLPTLPQFSAERDSISPIRTPLLSNLIVCLPVGSDN